MIDVLQFIAGIIILIALFFICLHAHLVSEKKLGKIIQRHLGE